jgi:hypothetical protein
MDARRADEIISRWPDASREAAELVLKQYGEPHEVTPTRLQWNRVGPWKRVIATETFFDHAFPAPHTDSVEGVLDYHVPVDKFTELAAFDGSVVVERTAGEISARCHDEQANFLALNLAHEICTGARSVQSAREHYAKEFLDARRHEPTPYMQELRFSPGGATADPDVRALTDEELERAISEGEDKGGG